MSVIQLQRDVADKVVSIVASGGTYTQGSTGFDFSRFAGGTIKMPAAWTAAVLGFKIKLPGDTAFRVWKYWDSQTSTFKYVSIGSSNADAATRPAANEVYTLPAEMYGGRGEVIPWSHDGSGNDVDQTAQRDFILAPKG